MAAVLHTLFSHAHPSLHIYIYMYLDWNVTEITGCYIDKKFTLVQTTTYYLNQCRPSLLTHICVSSLLIDVGDRFMEGHDTPFYITVPLYGDVIVTSQPRGIIGAIFWRVFRYTTHNVTYRQISDISCTSVSNKIVYHSDVIGAAPVQLHLHSRQNTWLQLIGQRQLQNETRNIQVWWFGEPNIRGLTVRRAGMYQRLFHNHPLGVMIVIIEEQNNWNQLDIQFIKWNIFVLCGPFYWYVLTLIPTWISITVLLNMLLKAAPEDWSHLLQSYLAGTGTVAWSP